MRREGMDAKEREAEELGEKEENKKGRTVGFSSVPCAARSLK